MARYLLLLAYTGIAFAQSPDAVLTRTLIDEIRALRQNLESTNVTSQRVQIVLYRLQSQTALVAGAQQRLDAARSRVQEAETHRRHLQDRSRSLEESIGRMPDGPQKKDMERELQDMRQAAGPAVAEESQRRAAEAVAASQLRLEQDGLSGLQSTLDRLDKVLDELARPKQ